MQGCGTGRKTDCKLASNFFGRQTLYLVDVLSNRADPVRADGLIDPFLLFSMHGRRGKPDFFLKRRDCHCDSSSLKLFPACTGQAAPVAFSPGTETIVISSVIMDVGSKSSPVSSRTQTLPFSTPSSSGSGMSSHTVPGCVQ